MKIGVISDTHDQIARVKKAVQIFNDEKVEMVMHCGDIVAPFTLQFYRELKCPIKFLFGNNTGDIKMHMDYARKTDFTNAEFGNFFAFEAGGRKIAAYHGDVPEIIDALVKCGNYDCVFSGHDHTARNKYESKVLSLNPGTLVDKHKDGMLSPSIAVYDTETNSAKLIEVGL